VTPNASHAEYVEMAADFGKAVLCEKPIAASVEGAERIVEACDEADVPPMIAYRMQTNPLVRPARIDRGGCYRRTVLVEAVIVPILFVQRPYSRRIGDSLPVGQRQGAPDQKRQ